MIPFIKNSITTQVIEVIQENCSMEQNVEQLLAIYAQLIELEEKRKENPYQMMQQFVYIPTHFLDGRVQYVPTPRSILFSSFSQLDYQDRLNELMGALDEMNAAALFAELPRDSEEMVKILQAIQHWDDLTDENQRVYDQLISGT